MSLAEKWSISTFYYDKGFYDGTKVILDMLYKAKTLAEVQDVVTNLSIKFKELEAVHQVIVENRISPPVEIKPAAPLKAKKTKVK
jgi:hypothetical protein